MSKKATPINKSLAALAAKVTAAHEGGALHSLALDLIDIVLENRDDITDESLAELSDSIRQKGVQQPILVRPGKKSGRYELIAGERRVRASKLAGRPDIPAMVKHVSEAEAETLQAIENIQRENWSRLEEARKLQRAMERAKKSGQKQPLETVAREWSKSVPWVSERLSLLKLSAPAKQLMDDGVTADVVAIKSVDRAARIDPKAGKALADRVRNSTEKRAVAVAGHAEIRRVKKGGKASPAPKAGVRRGSHARYAERLTKAATPKDKPSRGELSRRIREIMTNAEPSVHKGFVEVLKNAHALGKRLRKGGQPTASAVSDLFVQGIDDHAAAARSLFIKAFVIGVTGLPFNFETAITN